MAVNEYEQKADLVKSMTGAANSRVSYISPKNHRIMASSRHLERDLRKCPIQPPAQSRVSSRDKPGYSGHFI